MHPQIQQETPGQCFICGMDLEIPFSFPQDPELRKMTWRFWTSLFLWNTLRLRTIIL